MNQKKLFLSKILSIFALCLVMCGVSFGQVSLTQIGVAKTENFDGLGTSATATLPSGWKMDNVGNSSSPSNPNAANPTYAGSGTATTQAGNGNAGGAFNLGVGTATDRAIGFLSSGSFLEPRNIFGQFVNNTGQQISNVDIAFNFEKYRSAARDVRVIVSWSANGGAGTWNQIAALQTDFNDATVGTGSTTVVPAASTPKSTTLTGVNIPAGQSFFLRWDFEPLGSDTGARQSIGIDDFSITPQGSGPAGPNIILSDTTLPDFGSVAVGSASTPKVYTVSGTNLTDSITINAPAEFAISTAIGGPFSSQLVIPQSGGAIPETDIFVAFTPGSIGPKTGTITNTSTGVATPHNVAVSGTGAQSFAISGHVTYKGTQDLGGLTVVALQNGNQVATAVTNASGLYTLNLPGGLTYDVTIGTAGFAFTPPGGTFPNLAGPQTLNFNAVGTTLMISEFRNHGSGGGTDEFVELYNNADAAMDISGFAIFSADNATTPKYVVPGTALSKATVIPARGHYLVAGPGYSFAPYATPDGALLADIPDGAGIGVFVNSTPASNPTKIDAVGFAGNAAPFSEGTGLTPSGGITVNSESSFVRIYTPYPTDTDNNVADFSFVSTNAGNFNGAQSTLGTPGPESRTSPTFNVNAVTGVVFDAQAGAAAAPNRLTDPSNTAAAPLGTMTLRRSFVNNTGLSITKFRIRMIGFTTDGSPIQYPSGQAILRMLNSSDITVTKTDGSQVPVRGLTIEGPNTAAGGLNSSLVVNLAQPILNGATINVDMIIGIQASGRTVINVAVETLVQAPQSTSEHLVMGNPSNAVTDVNQPCNYLMEKAQYALAYCRDKGAPIWVSWHLDNTWIGSSGRTDDFAPDPALPADWYHVQAGDFQGSQTGFDRGHHRPSGDTTKSIPDNQASFLMTNMMAQASGNNQGPWENLETYTRNQLAGTANEAYIIAGGAGTGGIGANHSTPTSTIANGHVNVPEVTWKVIMILPTGTNDASRVTAQTRVFAVIMPNQDSIRPNDWHQYIVSVRAVEQLTGFNFFSNVPQNIQDALEIPVNNQP